MALFDTSRRRLETLEREVLSNPTPQNMVALAETLARMQNWTRAYEVARRSIEKFPDSEKCALTYQYVRKTQFQARIQELNRVIRTRPQHSDYEQLARLYLEDLNDRGKAMEIALEGLIKFPSSDTLHAICAQIRMDRFHQDFLANDCSEALRHGQMALATNPQHAGAMMILGRLYAECGAYEKAKPHIEAYLRLQPDDVNMRQLLSLVMARIPEAVHEIDDAVADIEQRHMLPAGGREMMELFQPMRGATQITISPAKVEQLLRGYEAMPGYKCAAALLKDGVLFAGHTRGLVPLDKFVALTQCVYRSADAASHKMDIGSFVDGELETSLGKVKLLEWKQLVLGILADRPAKQEDFDRALEKFQSFIA
ncbi:MAG: tetratricopeptide repeat protein [Planctomycetes bacterium]|nr:tetratricopeptide repeat protein [Planctomycetota bacterium]